MSGWTEVGPGPAAGEVIRVRGFANGSLVAVVRQTKGYKPKPLSASGQSEELVVVSETTLSLTFLPGVQPT